MPNIRGEGHHRLLDGTDFRAPHCVSEACDGVKDVRVYNSQMHDVVVYSRNGCHLCDLVKETLTQVQSEADFNWREVDIDADPQLRQKYTDQVPVVFIDGRKAFKYRMGRHQFLRTLAGRKDPVL